MTAVAPATGIPAGTIQFRIDGFNNGSSAVLNPRGQAANLTSTLSVGRHTVFALYTGNAGFNTRTSKTITQRIR